MANIEDILVKTDRIRKTYNKLDEVTAAEVFNGVKNVFRTNINNEQNRNLYKNNVKVLKAFEQLINQPTNANQNVATKGKSAEEVMKILNDFNNQADWYAYVMNEPAAEEPEESEETETQENSQPEQTQATQTTQNTQQAEPAPAAEGASEAAPANNVQESIDFLEAYNNVLYEDLAAYATKNINKNKTNIDKQKKLLFKQCRQILVKQGGAKNNTFVALYTVLKQFANVYDSTYANKDNGMTLFFSDWLNGKLMTPEQAEAKKQQDLKNQMAKVGEYANDAILMAIKAGFTDYNSFVTQLKSIAGVM